MRRADAATRSPADVRKVDVTSPEAVEPPSLKS